ncbi:hypothetical protein [Chelatococcus asaccharovorans]|uniref:Uncharacterized protein n=1 Tax=Chelatococcus asaccharovorans TaxID=28210 RepID=A0A2V3U2T1_9HYPH|nr:hypothetical protein [Chelatococcus asaccharovorans]MBS7702444.1 hypothetical protein [Chelatococcus asaccharovorans]PXW56350.1 hypothetical protein C7450_108100 [Chelatococcus asaccharovorans]
MRVAVNNPSFTQNLNTLPSTRKLPGKATFDTRSGAHHLGHAIDCCVTILDAMETGNLVDVRPVRGKASAIPKRLEAVIRLTKNDK